MTDAFVALFGVLAVVFAAMVLTLRQPMRVALALVALHDLPRRDLRAARRYVIAVFQVLIYVGAVMVFMVYTIMLLDDRDPRTAALLALDGPRRSTGVLAARRCGAGVRRGWGDPLTGMRCPRSARSRSRSSAITGSTSRSRPCSCWSG